LASVASFYDMLEMAPVGKHDVFVCTNISCSLRGADALLRAVQDATAADADFNVRAFECLGACDIAPMASVNGDYVGPLTPEDVPSVIDAVRAGRAVADELRLALRRVADPRAGELAGGGDSKQTARASARARARTPAAAPSDI